MQKCDFNSKLYVLIPTWDQTFLNKNIYKLVKKLNNYYSIHLLLDEIGSNPPFKYKVIGFLRKNSIFKFFRLTFYLSVICFFAKKKPVFFTYKGYQINILLAIISNLIPIKIITKTDSQPLHQSNNLKSFIRNKLILYSLNKSSLIITETQYWLSHYQSKIKKTPIFLYSNGADLSIKRINKLDNLPKKFIFFPGRLSYAKGVDKLANIFTRINNKNYDLVIAGSDSGDGSVIEAKRIISNNSMSNRVIWYESIQEPGNLYYLYENAAITLLSSTEEGLPNRMCESIALGTPVISFDVGSVKHLLNERLGFLVKPFDLDLYVSFLDDYLGDEELQLSLSKNCKKYGKIYLDENKIMPKLIDNILKCL